MIRTIVVGACLFLACGSPDPQPVPSSDPKQTTREAEKAPAPSVEGAEPLNITYVVDGQDVPLVGGAAEMEIAPGSATRMTTRVWDVPMWGDLDGDGDDDAALVLVHDPGGSGTFFYVAAALREDDHYRGTAGVLLGDRIRPQHLEVRNGMIVAGYLDRAPAEPMATAPSRATSRHLTLVGEELEAIELGKDERLYEGWVTVGHEVRSLAPCGGQAELWILGPSPALSDIATAYRQELPDAEPYTALFMVLVGQEADAPADGFGADYEGGIRATRFIHVWSGGDCGDRDAPVTRGLGRP